MSENCLKFQVTKPTGSFLTLNSVYTGVLTPYITSIIACGIWDLWKNKKTKKNIVIQILFV